MIPCTEFIPVYNMLFRYLDEKGGYDKVMDYWNYISRESTGLMELKELVEKHGIRGCFMYWTHTLNEEAADFTMTLDEEKGTFCIDMHVCPSKSRVLECKHVKAYPHYCKHCDILYRRVLEPLGYLYEYDMSRCDKAACQLRVTDKRKLGGE